MLHDPYRWHHTTITCVQHESKDVVSIAVQRPKNYIFRPGQHAIMKVTLADGAIAMRQYSFASAPSSDELWFTIVRTPGGIVSSWCVDHATHAQTITLSQPFTGPLDHDLSPYSVVCMIAGGSGITPLMSHIRAQRHATGNLFIKLLYSTRSAWRYYDRELTSSADLSVTHRVTDLEDRFSRDEIQNAAKGAGCVLICGSRQFVTDMRAITQTVIPSDHIFTEAFSLT